MHPLGFSKVGAYVQVVALS